MAAVQRLASQALPSGGAKEGNATVKGPPLASRNHSLQLITLLVVHTLLIALTVYLLPANLVWRKLQQHRLQQEDGGKSTLGTVAYDALVAAAAGSTLRNLRTTFSIMFGAPRSDTLTTNWIHGAVVKSLAPLLMLQSWFVARLKGWFDEAEAMDRGDRDEILARRRIGLYKRIEGVVASTFVLPVPVLLIHASLILCGAPLLSNILSTLLLAGYIGVLAALPTIVLLGGDEKEYIKVFSQAPEISAQRDASPRYVLLSRIVLCTLIGTVIGSSGILLDWETVWQVYPVPGVFGAGLGAIVGSIAGGVSYLARVPWRRDGGSYVERASTGFLHGLKGGKVSGQRRAKKRQ